ncbi:E3 ubiquitin-protein ligase Fancl [Helicoverpa armigera]|uniref:E3 ubiquitin-protein ligase Fancl n=1 Tax=Helicoverpa armigera TaxID=29058 RepID=UPI0030827166
MDKLGLNSSITKTKEDLDLLSVLERLDDSLQQNTQLIQLVKSNLLDEDILNEIKTIVSLGTLRLYFGKTMRDLKIVIEDNDREHEIKVHYKGPKHLIISDVKLPNSSAHEHEFGCITEITELFNQNVKDLARYFYELENIDEFCTVMEPIVKSFKDNYRRIFLDDRTWLHVEVTPEGFATNIHLVGQSECWHNKLQAGLLHWDHDKNIVDNIMAIFDFSQFSHPTSSTSEVPKMDSEDDNSAACGICLSTSLPDVPGLPLPLCQNSLCGVYYHRTCLYQWLVACAGSRPPAFGVANGSCPTCLQPITCSEKDN